MINEVMIRAIYNPAFLLLTTLHTKYVGYMFLESLTCANAGQRKEEGKTGDAFIGRHVMQIDIGKYTLAQLRFAGRVL
jgi:hypothetical protein